MTTKRARLRKSKSILGKTVSGSTNTRARRKALNAKRMAADAAADVAAAIKAAGKPPVTVKKKKNSAAKAAPTKK